MAKDKSKIDEDLLTGGASLSDSGDKSVKSAEKQAKKAEAAAKKAAAKKAKLQQKLDEVKKAVQEETDDDKKAKLDAEVKSLQSKISAAGSKKAAMQMAKRTQRIVKSVIAVVVVIGLLAAYVCTGTVRKGFVSYLGIPAAHFTAMTVSDGEHKAKVKVSTYNYYFATTYNQLQQTQSQYSQYGLDTKDQGMGLDINFDEKLSKQTTTNADKKKVNALEFLDSQVKDAIEKNYTYYLAAVAANDGKEPKITTEQQSDIDDAMKSYTDSAHQYGYTLSGYLVKAMGKGVTESVFRKEAKIAYIAQNYQDEMSKSKTASDYTDEQYDKYKSENKDDLVSVSIKSFECSTEDDAKAFKKALKADGSNFSQLASKYADTDFAKEANKEVGYTTQYHVTKAVLKNQGLALATADKDDAKKYPGLDWLFSSERKAGDAYQYSTSVAYVIEPAKLSDVKTINVRHILISPVDTTADSQASATNATDEQWATALKTAKSILNKWEKGDKTEDSFAKLAKTEKASSDTGSKEDGGLYENVTPGQMVNSFGYWCFSTDRKAGDTAIVKSDYGYHIMYFVGQGDIPVWKYTAQQSFASDDASTEQTKLEKDYKLKTNWLGSRYFEKDTDIDN